MFLKYYRIKPRSDWSFFYFLVALLYQEWWYLTLSRSGGLFQELQYLSDPILVCTMSNVHHLLLGGTIPVHLHQHWRPGREKIMKKKGNFKINFNSLWWFSKTHCFCEIQDCWRPVVSLQYICLWSASTHLWTTQLSCFYFLAPGAALR